MSYDLFLSAGAGMSLGRKAFNAYFRSRRNYTVKNGQSLYTNEDTVVYFIFDEPADDTVAFNLNFYRPHTFGLEAAIELEAFCKAFDATATDEDGNEGPFDRRKFLHAWNAGNRFAYKAMSAEQSEPVHTWPSARIRDVWLWNYTRPTNEQQQKDDIFTPAIFAIERDGKPISVVIWPPECTIVLPEVDAVLVPLAQTGKLTKKLALVDWSEVQSVAQPYHEPAKGLPRYRIAEEPHPPAVAAFLSRKRTEVGELKGVEMDQLMDRELVEEASRS